jgi:hypothetical protein
MRHHHHHHGVSQQQQQQQMEKGQQAVAAAAVEREVDMRRAGRRVFLFKAPVYLAKAWAEAGPGADLGRLFLGPAGLPVIEGATAGDATTATTATTTTATGEAADRKRKRAADELVIPQGVVGRLLAGGSEGAVREHTVSFVKLPEPSYCFSDSDSTCVPLAASQPSSYARTRSDLNACVRVRVLCACVRV